MLLHTKIDKFIVLNFPIVIFVVPEDVFDEVLNFLRVLVHHGDQKFPNLFLLELLIFIFIKLDELDIDQLSHLEGKVV
jgi:hypothetical protein